MGEATGRLLAMNLFKVGSSYDLSTWSTSASRFRIPMFMKFMS
jgi:hypothetical protein